MQFGRLMIAFLALGVVVTALSAEPASARSKRYKTPPQCVDRGGYGPTFEGFFFNAKPQPNGCAPPVYQYGQYVGQDPDPFIRLMLKRDPDTGYTAGSFAR